jgi:hypothetical protein
LAHGEVSPADLIQAVDQMSPEQAHELQQKLEAKLWEPVPQGFFTRMAVDIGVSYSSLDRVDLAPLSLSSGRLDVDEVSGMDVSLLWRLFSERFRFGLRFGSWAARDSDFGEAGYSRADVVGGNLSLVANYQWIRSDSWLVWTEVAPGAGSIAVETVDTPADQSTTLRSFDGSFGLLDLQAGASWRFNRVLCLFLSGGYRFAESLDLDEGGRATTVEVDARGPVGRFGLGVNF